MSPHTPPNGAPIPVAVVIASLRRLGVRDGELLMVHASLRRIGSVEGGATGVLDALDAAVGPNGALVMILGAVVDHEWGANLGKSAADPDSR